VVKEKVGNTVGMHMDPEGQEVGFGIPSTVARVDRARATVLKENVGISVGIQIEPDEQDVCVGIGLRICTARTARKKKGNNEANEMQAIMTTNFDGEKMSELGKGVSLSSL